MYGRFRSLTKDEAGHLLWEAQKTIFFPLIYLALATGMRQGELFGLRWEHVDFGHRFLSVCGTLAREHVLPILRPPKGGHSRRVDLIKNDVALLRAHRKRQLGNCASEWVFTKTKGKPLRKENFRHRVWQPLVKSANLQPLPFHELRHTCATLSLTEGIPVKVVQERLGHASAKMTLAVYAKVVPSLQRQAADQITGIFGDWRTSWRTREDIKEQTIVK